jgi:hypothetical protein
MPLRPEILMRQGGKGGGLGLARGGVKGSLGKMK